MRNILDNIPLGLIVALVMIVIIVLAVVSTVKAILRTVRNASRGVRELMNTVNGVNSTIEQISSIANELETEAPAVKSVGGGTKMYLERIKRDFPEFHNDDAENEVKNFVKNYIEVIYGGRSADCLGNMDYRNSIDLTPKENVKVANVKFNAVAIYEYSKSKEYATVTYRVSVGFNNSQRRVETRYAVKYTLRLEEHSIASKYMTCGNCGGTYGSTDNGVCPYCGAAVIKDTAFSWDVSGIVEI